jgi:aspartate aminotransferase
MPDNHRKVLRKALQSAQLVSWAYPSSTLMHSINKLDTMSIDLVRFQGRRDFVCEALSALGYRVLKPSGTFYVCVYIPRERTLGSTVEIEAADEDFCLKLAGRGVLVTPGRCFEWPGVFRISLTANDDQLKRAVEVLATMIRQTP